MKKYYLLIKKSKNKKLEPAKLAYSPLGKAFEEQTKTFENQRENQIEALEVLNLKKNQKLNQKKMRIHFPKEMRNNEIKI